VDSFHAVESLVSGLATAGGCGYRRVQS
jgi:hypothetical protein